MFDFVDVVVVDDISLDDDEQTSISHQMGM